MDFTIYTTGSAEFLELMLNGAAMITGSGAAEDLARIGAIIGMMLLALQATFNNQPISFQKAGLMLVLYMAFYGPTVTAVIEDTVSNQVRVVDNVPLGPVAVGSILSTISYEITRMGEQAVSTPEMTRYGLFSSLSTMAKVRDALRNPTSLDAFNNHKKSLGWDFPRTVREYLAFCTLNPVMLRTDKTIDALYRAAGTDDLMTAGGYSQYIQVHDGSAMNMKSCAEASSIVKTEMGAIISDVFYEILTKGFASEYKAGRILNGAALETHVNDSMGSMGLAGKSSQEFIKMSIIEPVFNTARVDALNHWQESLTAVALRDSLNQQQIQWAGKGDSFKHYMRPMIAFFEGLLYAMTPFMAFALMLGSPGLKILSKYLVLPLAVGLWMPLLSIVNAFTLWYAGAEIEAIGMGYDPTSPGFAMVQLMDIDQAISKALGIGGLLAASVPPLALFIVSGSAMVANGIMSQMTAADKFRSEDVNPRASNGQAPVLASEARYTSDQMTGGVHVTGAPQMAETITAKAGASALVQSLEAHSRTANETYQQNIGSAIQTVASTSDGRQMLASLGHQTSAQLGLSKNSQFTDAASKLQSLGYSKDEIAAGAYSVTAGAGFSLGVSGGVKLEDSERFQKMSSSQQQEARQAAAQLTSAVQSQLTDQDVYNTGATFTSAAQNMLSRSTAETLSKSITDAKQAQEQYQVASARQQEFAAGQNLNIKQAAATALTKGGLPREKVAEKLMQMAGETESGRAAFQAALGSQSIGLLSSDRDERVAMAAIRALNQDGRLGDLVRSEYSPFDFNINTGNAGRNRALADETPNVEGLRGRVEAQYYENRVAYEGERDMNKSGYENTFNMGREEVVVKNGEDNDRVLVNDESNRAVVRDSGGKLEQVGVRFQTTTPVEDGAKVASDKVGDAMDSAAGFAGIENTKAYQFSKDYVTGLIRNPEEQVKTIVKGAADTVESAYNYVTSDDKPSTAPEPSTPQAPAMLPAAAPAPAGQGEGPQPPATIEASAQAAPQAQPSLGASAQPVPQVSRKAPASNESVMPIPQGGSSPSRTPRLSD